VIRESALEQGRNGGGEDRDGQAAGQDRAEQRPGQDDRELAREGGVGAAEDKDGLGF
jgi:hypothetical protein